MFLKAINEAYSDITVIASGATTDGYQIPEPGIGDYHPYRKPDNFLEEFNLFDNQPIPHVIGEALHGIFPFFLPSSPFSPQAGGCQLTSYLFLFASRRGFLHSP